MQKIYLTSKKLRAPIAHQREHQAAVSNSQDIPKVVKVKVSKRKRANCGPLHNLEHDHKLKTFSCFIEVVINVKVIMPLRRT